MKIRLRNSKGEEILPPPGYTFVEICNEQDEIGCLIYFTSSGTLKVVTPADKREMEIYKNSFKVKTIPKYVELERTVDDYRNS